MHVDEVAGEGRGHRRGHGRRLQAVGAFVDFEAFDAERQRRVAKLSEETDSTVVEDVLKRRRDRRRRRRRRWRTACISWCRLVSTNEAIKMLENRVAATSGLTDPATAARSWRRRSTPMGWRRRTPVSVGRLFKTVDRVSSRSRSLPSRSAPCSRRRTLKCRSSRSARRWHPDEAGFTAAEAATAIDTAMRALMKPSNGDEAGVQGSRCRGRRGACTASTAGRCRRRSGGADDGRIRAAMEQTVQRDPRRSGAMTLTGENAKGSAKDLRALADASGSTAKAFEEQAKSASSRWDVVEGVARGVRGHVGTVLFPVIRR